MEIIKKEKVITEIDKKSGEIRRYFLFGSFELAITETPPHHIQPQHYHKETVELNYVIEGTMIAKEGDREVKLSSGEVVCFRPGHTFHSIENPTDKKLIFATIKTPALSGSYREIFQRDKFTKK